MDHKCVNSHCYINVAPTKSASVTYKTPDGTSPENGKRILLKSGATYRVFGEDDFPETGDPTLAEASSKLPLQINTGATFTVEKAARASFAGGLSWEQDTTKFGSVFQWGGTTNIESGSELSVERGMQILGGNLYTRAHPTLSYAKQIATIAGDLRIDSRQGGQAIEISICSGTNPHKYGFLAVTGDVHWNAGTFKPYVDASDQDKVDKWMILGSLTVGGTAKVAPVTVNYDANLGLPANFRATFLIATGGINGNATVESTAPAYQIFVLQPGGNERRWALGPG